MKIRDMLFADCEEVAMLEKECFSIPWSKTSLENEFNFGYASFLVAEEEEKIIGYVGIHNICGVGDITNIAVLPQFRRQKVAEKLLDELVGREKKDGAESITLEVREGNIPAIGLYKKFGFEKVGMRKDYYPDENAILMTLTLNKD
ncbi:MAG: ribosomal protein S18-alanine N-acetyltransferase [Bacillota bacterium]|nr:ribosomal protein S18-alanine N-acetyltransferase [Bacillota bacterium]